MAWIHTIPPEHADPVLLDLYGRLRALFPSEYADPVPTLVRADGTAESVVASHSLLPQAMFHLFAGLGALLGPGLPLDRRRQEMIATVVSSLNRCFY
jgi:hypothetical protein